MSVIARFFSREANLNDDKYPLTSMVLLKITDSIRSRVDELGFSEFLKNPLELTRQQGSTLLENKLLKRAEDLSPSTLLPKTQSQKSNAVLYLVTFVLFCINQFLGIAHGEYKTEPEVEVLSRESIDLIESLYTFREQITGKKGDTAKRAVTKTQYNVIVTKVNAFFISYLTPVAQKATVLDKDKALKIIKP